MLVMLINKTNYLYLIILFKNYHLNLSIYIGQFLISIFYFYIYYLITVCCDISLRTKYT